MDLVPQILSESLTKTQALRLLDQWQEDIRAKFFEENKAVELPKGLEDLTASNYEEVFKKAKEEISNIEPLYLYLPKELEREEQKKIVEKLRQEYGQNFLIEIKFNGELIGGCAMSYKGIYKDYSLHNKIVQNREKIRQLLWK